MGVVADSSGKHTTDNAILLEKEGTPFVLIKAKLCAGYQNYQSHHTASGYTSYFLFARDSPLMGPGTISDGV